MKKLYQWFDNLTHPADTSMEQVRARVFLTLLAAAFITMLIVTGINVAWWLSEQTELNRLRIFDDLIALMAMIVAFYLHQRGWGRIVRALFLATTIVLTSFSLPPTELSRFLIAYTMPVIFAGFIVAPFYVFVMIGLTFASYTWVWYSQNTTTLAYEAISMLFVFLIGFATWFVATFWENTLRALHQSQNRLAELNTQLEQRVSERTSELDSTNSALEQEIIERKRGEQELALKAELLDVASDLVLLLDEQGNVLYANQAAQTFGVTPSGLMQRGLMALQPQADPAQIKVQISQLLKTSHNSFEMTIPGSPHPIYTEVHVQAVQRGGKSYVLADMRDITARKNAEHAARASDELYRAMFEKSSAVQLIIDPALGVIVDANQSASDFYGYTPEELRTLKITDINSLPPDQVHAEMTRAKTEQRNYFNFPHRLKSGEMRQVEVYSMPIPAQGKTLLYSIVHDITARRQAERALQQSEKRYRDLFENASIAIFESTLEGKPVAINAEFARIFGYASSQEFMALVKNVATDLYADPNRRTEIIRLRAENPQLNTFENVYRRKDGSSFLGKLVLQDLTDANGATFGFEGFIEDITERRRSEQALREREEQLSLVLQSTQDGFWDWNVATGRVYFSPRWAEMLGYSPDEIEPTVHAWAKIEDPQDHEHMLESLRAHITGRSAFYEFEQRLRTKSGEWKWILNRGQVVVRDADGKPLRMVGTHSDITARKQVEQALRESEERFSTIFHASPVPITISRLDGGGYIDLNDVASRFYGYSREQILGHTAAELNLWVNLEDRARMYDLIRTQGRVQNFETQGRTQAGEIRDIVFSTELLTLGGTPCSLTVINDITERKRAESALRESEARSRALLNALPDMMFIQSKEGIYLDYHAPETAKLAAPPEMFLGKPMAQVLPAEIVSRFIPVFEHTLATGELQILEYTLGAGDAAHQFEARTVRCGADTVLTIVRDVTARKQAEAELRYRSEELARANAQLTQANRLKDEFLAMMSHELRTPLNTILGMTEALQEQIYGAVNDEQLQALTAVRESGAHLLSIINDILDLSKIEAGKMTLDLAPTQIEMVCQASLRFIKQSAHKKRLRVSFTSNQTNAMVHADERLLKQALVNLLTNAVKFTPENGAIVLELDCDPAKRIMRLIVSDTGIGIAPADQARLFRPFVQLDSQLNRQYNGTGLGLALVARIVAMHGGSVSLNSEVGQGSSFIITLPCMVVQDDANVAELFDTVALTPRRDAATPMPVILLADDNLDALNWLSDYLRHKSFEVVVARDGDAAIEAARTHKPAVVLMDIQMPGMDGLEAIRTMRADPTLAHLPIIALTALAMSGDRERCLAAGANDYLTKPIDLRQLIELVQRYVKG